MVYAGAGDSRLYNLVPGLGGAGLLRACRVGVSMLVGFTVKSRVFGRGKIVTGVATQPWQLDACECVKLFRGGELSPLELFDALVARIERFDKSADVGQPVNSVFELLPEERAKAVAATAVYARADVDDSLPALLGVPVLAKEKHGIAGCSQSSGVWEFRDRVAEVNHPVIDRIFTAGGCVHARTTTPEFCCATVTHSRLWGVTRNPWGRDFSPGGSSGGSAAALACGFGPLATASDIAGSTRLPAAFCGVLGYKAPYGTVPGEPPLSVDWYRGDGAMARSVRDLALLSRVLRGVSVKDPASIRSAGFDFVADVPADEVLQGLRGLRVAVCVRLGDYVVHAETVRAVEHAVSVLEGFGARVSCVDFPWSSAHIHDVAFAHFGHIMGAAMREQTARVAGLADYTVRFMEDAARAAERMTLLASLREEALLQRQLYEVLDDFDVLVSPVSGVQSLDAAGSYVDGVVASDGLGGSAGLPHYWQGHMTLPFNLANRCPVVSIPVGETGEGLPIGAQIVGAPYDEGAVFRVARAVELLLPRSRIAPDFR